MKIIDEKGRLFGKVNLIDALLVLLVALVAVVFVVKGVGAAGAANADKADHTGDAMIDFTVFCNGFNNELCDSAMAYADDFANGVGNQIMNSGEYLNAYITGVSTKPYYLTETDDEGNSIAVVDQARTSLLFTIRAKAEITGNAYCVGNQEIRIGKSYIVKTPELEYTGTVTALEVVHE